MEFINAGLELGGFFLLLFVKLVLPLIIYLLLLGAMLFVTMLYITKLNNVYKEMSSIHKNVDKVDLYGIEEQQRLQKQKSDCELKLQEMKVGSELNPLEKKIQERANALTLENEVI